MKKGVFFIFMNIAISFLGLAQEEKENFKRSFNFILNTQARGNVVTGSREFQGAAGASGGAFKNGSKFSIHQLRLEARGDLLEKVFYRLRHRLSGGRVGTFTDLDNADRATDNAYVGYKFNDKFTGIIGKMCVPYGGFEFDWNPVFVYEYSDIIEEMDNFLVGIDLGYKLGNQEFRFNIANARTRYFKGNQYGKAYDYDSTITESKYAYLYTLNWNSSFFDGMLKTRYSYSIAEQAKNKYMTYVALGHQLQLNKFRLTFDYMRSFEDIDKKGYLLGNGVDQNYGSIYDVRFENRSQKALYNSFVLKIEYRLTDYLNVFFKGMYETAHHKDKKENRVITNGADNITVNDELYRTSLGYFGGIEFYTNKDENLHFYLTYVGRDYRYNQQLQDFGLENMNTNKFILGVIWAIPMYTTKF